MTYEQAVKKLKDLLKKGIINEQDYKDMESYFYFKKIGDPISYSWMESHPRDIIWKIERNIN